MRNHAPRRKYVSAYRSSAAARTPAAPRPFDLIPQLVLALAGGAAVFSLLLVGTLAVFTGSYLGKVFPGVAVAGVDLSGLTPEEAAPRLSTYLDYPQRGRILLRDGEKIWLAAPAQLGFYLDPQGTAVSAFNYGRSGNPLSRVFTQFTAWYLGVSLPPRYVFDQRAAQSFLAGIAAQNDLPAVEASLSVQGAEVIVKPGQVGRRLDMPATLAALEAQLQTLSDGEVQLAISEETPAILDVEEQAQLARSILSEPLELKLAEAGEDDPGPWTFERETLAQLLTIQRVSGAEGDKYQVGLQAEGLRAFLQDLAPDLQRDRQNARFIFNDDSRQLEVIQPAVIGRALDVDATITSINEKLLAGEHSLPLVIDTLEPEVADDAKAKKLGITELVSSHTSYFYGSSSDRIQNIKTASSRFHGLLVPPGAAFSMGEVLGDVSLDNGYAEALIIFGNRTIKGVGGGVCQVSTTLFRTAFFGGFPIVERHPHAYRVYYYEQTSSGGHNPDYAGLDATVFVPLVDFKFTNDTPNWLLMETYVEGYSLTWKFYSTSDGRTVDWETTGLRNVEQPPEPVYEENPELAKGEIKQVDWEVDGADVTVTRIVQRDGQVIYEDTFTTRYMPWRAVYQYGPGTKGMPPDPDKKKKDKDE